MNRRVLLTSLCGLVFLASGPFDAAAPRTLTVFAAASLTDAFRAAGSDFERENPGWKVRFSFAASSLLQTQISQGAPADVFASADYAQMRPLLAAHLVAPPRTFARNRLVLVVPHSNPAQVRGARDLARRGLRLVTSAPNVPIGSYTAQLLRNLERLPGYPSGFAAAVERNVVSREPDVRGILAKIELGEGDAGVVYATDARTARHAATIHVPDRANVTVEYPVAEVSGTANAAGAARFVAYLVSPAGQRVLKRFGFR